VRAGAGALFWSKWGFEEEKTKLGTRGREVQQMIRGGRNLPRGNWPLLLQERHADLLPLHLFDRFRLRSETTLFAGTCAGGRSLIQRGNVYNLVVRDSW
jgi:hypothetical protein